MPPTRPGGVDEEAFEVDDLAGAHLFQLVFHVVVGGDDVHVGAGGFDFALGDRELVDVPVVEAAGLADVDVGQHRAVGHAAPAHGEVHRHQVAVGAAGIVLAREHAGGDVEVRAGGERGVALLQLRAVIEVDLHRRRGSQHAGAGVHRRVLTVLEHAQQQQRRGDDDEKFAHGSGRSRECPNKRHSSPGWSPVFSRGCRCAGSRLAPG